MRQSTNNLNDLAPPNENRDILPIVVPASVCCIVGPVVSVQLSFLHFAVKMRRFSIINFFVSTNSAAIPHSTANMNNDRECN